jgi:hypothetical protein
VALLLFLKVSDIPGRVPIRLSSLYTSLIDTVSSVNHRYIDSFYYEVSVFYLEKFDSNKVIRAMQDVKPSQEPRIVWSAQLFVRT